MGLFYHPWLGVPRVSDIVTNARFPGSVPSGSRVGGGGVATAQGRQPQQTQGSGPPSLTQGTVRTLGCPQGQ